MLSVAEDTGRGDRGLVEQRRLGETWPYRLLLPLLLTLLLASSAKLRPLSVRVVYIPKSSCSAEERERSMVGVPVSWL